MRLTGWKARFWTHDDYLHWLSNQVRKREESRRMVKILRVMTTGVKN